MHQHIYIAYDPATVQLLNMANHEAMITTNHVCAIGVSQGEMNQCCNRGFWSLTSVTSTSEIPVPTDAATDEPGLLHSCLGVWISWPGACWSSLSSLLVETECAAPGRCWCTRSASSHCGGAPSATPCRFAPTRSFGLLCVLWRSSRQRRSIPHFRMHLGRGGCVLEKVLPRCFSRLGIDPYEEH